MPEPKKIDAVFEGGGVKGIGLVGAYQETEAQGYQVQNVAGTSAGAIVAALVAAGYSASELKEIMDRLDYRRFKDKSLVDKIPLIGPMLSLGFENGIYEGDYFEGWLKELLSAKNVSKFGDLIMKGDDGAELVDPKYRWKLQVIATDLTHGRLLRLPRDLEKYGRDPNEFSVARAVRMSMSIPFFFEPINLEDSEGRQCSIVDGGVLSNFPVWIFDDGSPNPPWPTLGYKLVDDEDAEKIIDGAMGSPRNIKGPISMLAALFTTMMEAHDKLYIEDCNFARTIPIPTLGVGTIDFDLDAARSQNLFESGRKAAQKFFDRWDFEFYKHKYRENKAQVRQERLLS